jgi:hypothetical protein
MSTRPGRSSISITTLASSLLGPRVRFTASSVTSSPEPAVTTISPEMFESVTRPFAPILNCREIRSVSSPRRSCATAGSATSSAATATISFCTYMVMTPKQSARH